PFLWETPDQPPARWHDNGDGPVHYLSDTSDGAWAEFLRHEEIIDPEDLAGVERTMWAVDVDEPPVRRSGLPFQVVTGGSDTYVRCRSYARRLRAEGESGFSVEGAALQRGEARGWRVHNGLQPGKDRTGRVLVLFGPRPDLTAWPAATAGRPPTYLLERVRYYG
ncbi:MAG: RES domain-containing protein, partial [Acidimicrobiia bacterium]|nr:RES domain-containing protein [Acidimicrobiia bacterium]